MNRQTIKNVILELCHEDNYGLWELYWAYRGSVGTLNCMDDEFLDSLQDLVASGTIISYDRAPVAGEFVKATFELSRARTELGEIRAHKISDRLYWFGCENR